MLWDLIGTVNGAHVLIASVAVYAWRLRKA